MVVGRTGSRACVRVSSAMRAIMILPVPSNFSWGRGCRSATLPSTYSARSCSERFSSGDLEGLEDVDGFGDLAGVPGAAAEFAQDAPGLELGVGAFAGGAQLGVGGVGGFPGGGLVPAPVRGEDVLAGADVALIGQHD